MDFPDEIKVCRENYSRTYINNNVVSIFDGYTRTRRITRKDGVYDTVQFICDEKQFNELYSFYRKASTSLYFNIDLLGYDGIVKTKARFSSNLKITIIPRHYKVSAILYIPDPRFMPESELDKLI